MTAMLGLSKEAVFDQVGYEPHYYQRKIHRHKARHKVAAAGRRFGKSMIGGMELVPEALFAYTMRHELQHAGIRREFWICGPEYSDSEKEFRVLHNNLTKLDVPFDRPGTYNNPESGDMHISLWDGTFEVHAKSAKYPGTLVGEGLSGVIMAESAKMKELVWVKYIRPTLADFRGWSLFNSTPEGKNWFYRLWQRGQDPASTQWASWRMPSWCNPSVFPAGATNEGIGLIQAALRQKERSLLERAIAEANVDEEIVDMMMEMSEERFNQEVGASFTEFVGRVFKDFDEELHVTKIPFMHDRPVYLATDYGWTNPFVALFIQTDIWENVYVIGEYRAAQRDINDIARDLASFPIISAVKNIYPDPADPGDTAVLSKALKVPAAANTGGELKWRLELIRQRLRYLPDHGPNEMKQSQLLIDRSCTELIREMLDYRYPETKAESDKSEPEKPMDKDDHGPEALGRFMRGYFGGPAEGPGRARARVRRAVLT